MRIWCVVAVGYEGNQKEAGDRWEHSGWALREMRRISSGFGDRGVRTGTAERRDGGAAASEANHNPPFASLS